MTNENADDTLSMNIDSKQSTEEEEEAVQMESVAASFDAEEKAVNEEGENNPELLDVALSEDGVDDEAVQAQEELSELSPTQAHPVDSSREKVKLVDDLQTLETSGVEEEEAVDEQANEEISSDLDSGETNFTETTTTQNTPVEASLGAIESSPMQTPSRETESTTPTPSLEECLFGSSTTPADRTLSSQEDHPSDNSSLVDDDWIHIREQGLWKNSPHTIQLALLRKIASQVGIEDEGSHRAVAWRVMLGYLPTDNREWESTLTERRNEYKTFVKEWFANPHDCLHGDELRWKHRMPPKRRLSGAGGREGEEEEDSSFKTMDNATPEAGTSLDENTLQSPIRDRLKKAGLDVGVLDSIMRNFNSLQISKADNSQSGGAASSNSESTADFVESVTLLDEIRKDVDRTFPDLKFFLDPESNLGKRRYAALERILFTWSKFNKGVKYVQGMNEIVGTIYYVLANDWNEEWAQEAEADTFWLFGILLGDMRDVFISHLDNSETGIYSRIKMMQTLLCRHDPEIIEHFDDIGIECSFFAIRWWTTLLSREFLLPDTIRLWDSMFASTHKDNFLCYVCVTMVIMIREQLLKGDFSACLRTLQSYPSIRMDELLTASRTLWLYERQITVACHKGGIGLQQALEAVKPPDSIIMAF